MALSVVENPNESSTKRDIIQDKSVNGDCPTAAVEEMMLPTVKTECSKTSQEDGKLVTEDAASPADSAEAEQSGESGGGPAIGGHQRRQPSENIFVEYLHNKGYVPPSFFLSLPKFLHALHKK
jgi:hypothetical protein